MYSLYANGIRKCFNNKGITSIQNMQRKRAVSILKMNRLRLSVTVSVRKFNVSTKRGDTLIDHCSSTNSNVKINTKSNVNTDDVKRHESLDDWWDKNGSMKGLHQMNSIRLQLVRNGLVNTGKLKSEIIKTSPTYLSGMKLLEVGCGAGIFTECIARLGADVTALDPSEKLISIARSHSEKSSDFKMPNYVNQTIEQFSINSANSFDAVVASEVIEHVPNKLTFIESCINTLKPGGSIFLTTPNRTRVSWLATIVVAENILKLLPKGIHDWNDFITPSELEQVLVKSGCKIVLVNGMMYYPLTGKWGWIPLRNVHYALHAVKL